LALVYCLSQTLLLQDSYSWPSSHTSNGLLKDDGSGNLTWSTIGGAGITSDSLDFTELVDSATLDANFTIASAGYSWDFNDIDVNFEGGIWNTAGNVGIGITNPSYRLHVHGNVAHDYAAYIFNDHYDGYGLRIYTDDSTGENSENILLVGNAGGERFAVKGSGLVGINDATPGALLEIQDNDSETELFAISSSSVGDYFVVKNDGKVGIGTAAPQEDLEIHKAAGDNPHIYLSDGNVSHGMTTLIPTNVFGDITTWAGNNGGLALHGYSDSTSGDALLIQGISGGTGTLTNAPVTFRAGKKSGTSATNVTGNDLAFNFQPRSGTLSYMTILGGGNVGIGDTDPAYKLSVDGTASISDDFYVGDGLIFADISAASVSMAGGLEITGDLNVGDGDLFVDSVSKRVGIGMTNPVSTFDVREDILGGTGSTITYGSLNNAVWASYILGNLDVYSDDGSTGMTGVVSRIRTIAEGDFVSGQAKTSLAFHTNTGNAGSLAEAMRINSAGNVGIGLNDPGEKLSVAGNVMIGDADWSDGTTSGDLAIQGNVGIGTTTPTDQFVINDGTNNYIYTDKTNNRLKIGISEDITPAQTLEIAGNLEFDSVTGPGSAEISAIGMSENTAQGTSLEAGTYYYAVAYITSYGTAGDYTNSTNQPHITISASSSISLVDLPISPDPRVTGRRIFRTQKDGTYFYAYKLYDLADNTTTSWTDNGIYSLNTDYKIYRNPNTTAGIVKLDGSNAMLIQSYNTGLGLGVFSANTSGRSLVAVGRLALGYNTTGESNVALGYAAEVSNTTGSSNIGIGYTTLYQNKTGNHNTGIGYMSLRTNSEANYTGNTGVGSQVLMGLITNNNYNTAFGYKAGQNFLGTGNLFLGGETGHLTAATTVGNYNTFIGYDTGDNAYTGADRNILIGYSLDLQASTSDNQLSIGNLIFGTGLDGTGTTISTGNIGIGTANLTQKLEVAGSASISSDLYLWGNLFGTNASISNNLDVIGDLDVTGNFLSDFDATLAASHSFAGDLSIGDDLTVGGDLNVTGIVNFTGISSFQLIIFPSLPMEQED